MKTKFFWALFIVALIVAGLSFTWFIIATIYADRSAFCSIIVPGITAGLMGKTFLIALIVGTLVWAITWSSAKSSFSAWWIPLFSSGCVLALFAIPFIIISVWTMAHFYLGMILLFSGPAVILLWKKLPKN